MNSSPIRLGDFFESENINTTPKNTTSRNTTSKNTTSRNTTSRNTTSRNTTSRNTTSRNTTSRNTTSRNTTSRNITPKNTTPENITPENITPENITPKKDCIFSTRYRGSKQKILDWIWDEIKDLDFHTFLDAMGGTGSVAYKAKKEGKKVTYNDKLKFNFFTGFALIENDSVILNESDVSFLLEKHDTLRYPTFVQDTFNETYFTDEENAWIDMVISNINLLGNKYKKAIAMHCLFQACIIKRPYNLFHRKNLYLRLNDVKRSFGNKVTWDKPFNEHFSKFVKEVNNCIFSNGEKCNALNYDVFDIPGSYDLVYIDTPYLPEKGEIIDYRDAYHFLEGLAGYECWPGMVDAERKHKPLIREYCVWNDVKKINIAFDKLFDKFKDSIIVVSYRSDGIPSEEQLVQLLKKYKKNVREVKATDFKYVLSKKESKELLFIAY
ncbi:DNA methyltransferase [Methanosarcina sp. KYL-1]|nr:DNA adenine methylase [Methanosarcina sp. KYL-1]MCQ1534591.1 DNA methyltransferase [Methanosarcina sp. KYL-1]